MSLLDPMTIDPAFDEVAELIATARARVFQAVNTQLIDLYWQVGAFIHRKLSAAEWGDGVVADLARYLAQTQPGVQGFSRQNLFRMRKFYEVWEGDAIVSPLVRQLPWTHHTLLLGQCKRQEERRFYLQIALREGWSKRDLERQLKSALFERTVLHPPRMSAALTETRPEAASIFKDVYVMEFLGLGQDHSEQDLHRALLDHLRRFLLELGRDFCFIGSEVVVQVGGRDFRLDLLFFHRGLNALVAIELKAGPFEPEHLGKLEFYLEALDRDVRKPHEGPSIGLLLCASKDAEVVEYALSRAMSPALVAEYQLALPPKALIQARLHEVYQRLAGGEP